MKVSPIDIKENRFVEADRGRAILPSLINKEQEKNFKINHVWFDEGKTLMRSLGGLRTYDNSDNYWRVYTELSASEVLVFKFIARFKSVQKIHLLREAEIFPELYNRNKINAALKSLFLKNLIWRWEYQHPVYNDSVDVFTLSDNGYFLLKMLFSNEKYFYPSLFLADNHIPPVFHVRFWETIDVYQILISTPAYRGSTTMFKGDQEAPLMTSPLQISLATKKNQIQKMVFYPVLLTDSDVYYKTVISRWTKFVEGGKQLNREVNGLQGDENVLTFYLPTAIVADQFVKKFNLDKIKYPIVFMIGSLIKKYGVINSFYQPILQDGKATIGPCDFNNLLKGE